MESINQKLLAVCKQMLELMPAAANTVEEYGGNPVVEIEPIVKLAEAVIAKAEREMTILSVAQYKVLRLWVLGGIDAIGEHSTKTIDSLIVLDFVDNNGPTAKAKAYVDQQESKTLDNLGK